MWIIFCQIFLSKNYSIKKVTLPIKSGFFAFFIKIFFCQLMLTKNYSFLICSFAVSKARISSETIHAEIPLSILRCSTGFLSEKRTQVQFHAVNALKEKSRKRKQFFPMITAIIRKLTPTMETIYADNKKTVRWENQSVVYDARRHLSKKKRTRVRFHAVDARKEKSRKHEQFFSDGCRDNQKTHGDNGNYLRRQ